MTTLDYVHRLVIPVAYDLLPPQMATREATAMLLAIGLQESRFEYRQQMGDGPAMGFWQFERGGGVAGVLSHRVTSPIITALCEQTFQYSPTPRACHEALEHQDVLAAVFARLLLWTVPGPLPGRDAAQDGWMQYRLGWRPGRPHRETWDGFYAIAWDCVDGEDT